jgi:hypothetical protein
MLIEERFVQTRLPMTAPIPCIASFRSAIRSHQNASPLFQSAIRNPQSAIPPHAASA